MRKIFKTSIVQGFAGGILAVSLLSLLGAQTSVYTWANQRFLIKGGPPVTADATARNIVGTTTTGQVPLNVQQRTGAAVDAFKVYANGGYRLRVDSNGTLLLNASFQVRSDSITGTTTPGTDMTAAIAAARVVLRVATATATADRMIQLPAANGVTAGTMYLFYDATGEAATKNITINRRGSDTINGATNKVIATAYGGAIFISDGTSAWFCGSLPSL